MTGGSTLQQYTSLQGTNLLRKELMYACCPASGCFPEASGDGSLEEVSDELAKEIMEDYLCGVFWLRFYCPCSGSHISHTYGEHLSSSHLSL